MTFVRARRVAWGAVTWSVAAHLFLFGWAVGRAGREATPLPRGIATRIEFDIRGVPTLPVAAPADPELPLVPPVPGAPAPTLTGPADAYRDTTSSPWPSADVDTPDRRAAAHGGGDTGAPPSWTGRHDGDEELHAQSFNDPEAYRLERHRDSRERLTPESIARLPDPGLDAAHREAERRALAGEPAPEPRPDPGAAEDLDPGLGLPASGPPAVEDRVSAADRSGAIATGPARPWNPSGDPATEAPRHGPRADDVDSAQASSERHPIPFELSRPTNGGRGGEGVAGPVPGQGNSRQSTRAGRSQGGTPHDVAAQADGGMSTRARPQSVYLRKVFRKLLDAIVFPPELEAMLEQGQVVVSFTLRVDGSVHDVRITRGSGFDEFDRAVLIAVDKAAPFDRMPASVANGQSSMQITTPIRFKNPMIR
jgi:TonB family protein